MRYFLQYNDERKAINAIKSIPNREYEGYEEVTEEEYNAVIEAWKNKRPITTSEFQSMLEEVL